MNLNYLTLIVYSKYKRNKREEEVEEKSKKKSMLLSFIVSLVSISDDLYYYRPMMILLCGMLLFNLPIVIYKIRLCINSIVYILFCNDKSYTLPINDPSIYFKDISNNDSTIKIQKKTIYFIRHGESTWNDIFNQGTHRTTIQFVVYFIPNLFYAIFYEIYLLLSGKMDSYFYDAPLSKFGIQQINDVSKFLYQYNTTTTTTSTTSTSSTTTVIQSQQEIDLQRHISILRCDIGAPKSKLVASNLRRAVSTMIGIFYNTRFMTSSSSSSSSLNNDKILILPSLQEISPNPDTLCITPPHTIIQASWIEQSLSSSVLNNNTTTNSTNNNNNNNNNNTPYCTNYQHIYNTYVDMSLHTIPNKPLRNKNGGIQRIYDFCNSIFSYPITEEYIIVGGHSLWFRTFFQCFIPYSIQHIAKQKKLINGSIIVFDLLHISTKLYGSKYMIDPKSIQIIYGGFSK